MWLQIPGRIKSGTDVSPENREAGLNPEGSGHISAPAGIFSLRRARYFNEARFDQTGRGVRRADIAEAAIAEAEAVIAHHRR
jgi:hypothetical protein